MAKVRGTEVKTQDKTNKSGSKKLSPTKTPKKDIGTKSSDKVSSTSKISKTSKTAISKTNKSSVAKIIKVSSIKRLRNRKGLNEILEHSFIPSFSFCRKMWKKWAGWKNFWRVQKRQKRSATQKSRASVSLKEGNVFLLVENWRQSNRNSFSISVGSYTPTSLTLRVDNGVDYAMFPFEGTRWCGFAKMGPDSFKPTSRSLSTVVRASIQFLIISFTFRYCILV